MMSKGRPGCPVEGCDGDLYREFVTGLSQSTAQMMRWGGLALIVGPVVFGGPFLFDYAMRGSAGAMGMVLAAIAVPMVAGVILLRRRARRLAVRSEQQRCNRCGNVVPLRP